MDSLLEKGEGKIAFICSAPYVKNREQFGIELLAAPSELAELGHGGLCLKCETCNYPVCPFGK